jgi:hypothetical protein
VIRHDAMIECKNSLPILAPGNHTYTLDTIHKKQTTGRTTKCKLEFAR